MVEPKFFLSGSLLEHENGHISEVEILTDSQILGAEEGNRATIRFTPATALPQSSG